jgi:polyisoprenoid-binding protein YceI
MTWEFDPVHSAIEFENVYLGILTVRGRFKQAEAQLDLDEVEPTRSSISATIDAASIETHNQRRDDTLRSADYLDAERFPTIAFQSKRVERRGDRFGVIGVLTIHGVSREVELDTLFNGEIVDGRGICRRGFTASVTIARSDFGVHVNAPEPMPTSGESVRILLEVACIKRDEGKRDEATPPVSANPP